jgi:putative ABC transport system permease protein
MRFQDAMRGLLSALFDMLKSNMLGDLLQAIRALRKSPAFAIIAIASLALGIGANVTIYSMVREMLLDDISARQPDRLARVVADVTYAQYRDLQRTEAFQDVAFEAGFFDMIWNFGTHSEVAWEMITSPNFFDVLGVSAARGRLYSERDDGRPVAVVSYGFWRRRLGSDPGIIGRSLQFNGRLYTILGVLPRDYRSIRGHGVSPEVYRLAGVDSVRCHLFGRLRLGFTREQTGQILAARAVKIGGQDFARQVSRVWPLAGLGAHESLAGEDRYIAFFGALLGTAFLLAIIACFNVAGLLLARGLTRRRELAVRKALGASRVQLARHLLAEGFVLVASGAGVGLAIDAFLRNQLSYVRWPSAYNLPFEFHFQSDQSLFVYALSIAFIALLLSSLIPSWRGADADVSLAMKRGEPALSIRRWSLRNTFLAVQLALSAALLILGAVFLRGFLEVSTVDPGFDVAQTAIAVVHSQSPDHRGENGWKWRDGAVRAVKDIPGVVAVTSIGTLPFMGELPAATIRRKDQPASLTRDAFFVGAGEDFAQVLGIPILRGRDFELADRSRQPAPALVSETLARELFGNQDPIGAQLLVGKDPERTIEVIGVTRDVRMRTLGEGSTPVFFTPFSDTQLLVRAAGDSGQWAAPLRRVLQETDSNAAIDVRPLSDAAAGAIFPMRVAAGFLGSLSAIGLVLVLTGLYSAVSYATRRRTREMAIRSAIGATRSIILWTATRDAIAVLVFGIVIGFLLAIAAIRPLVDVLPSGVNPWSPLMFAAAGLLLFATGAGAAFLPARFAANADPALALREE